MIVTIPDTETKKILNNNGAKLWSTSSGSGIPFIFCNGGPGCDDYLGPVSSMIEDLCLVVRFEHRGCGRSDWDKRYDLETRLEDIDFVRKVYGFERFVIAGHSAGVGELLAYTLKHPDRVIGMIGLAGGSVVNDHYWRLATQENLAKYGEDNGGQKYISDPDVNPIKNASWNEFIKTPTLLRDLSKLDVPAVFINAGNDARPNWPTEQLANLLVKGEYVEIPDAGHFIWVSHTNELKKELRAAVKKLAPCENQKSKV